MKIIRTKEKEEIEISITELKTMQIAPSGKMRETAYEILKMLKGINNQKISIGVDLAKEVAEDESCILTALKTLNKEVDESVKLANHEPLIKTDFESCKKDLENFLHEAKARSEIAGNIRKEEREKIEKHIAKLKDEFVCYNCLYWNVMVGDGPGESVMSGRTVENERKRGALTALDDLTRLIRKEQNDDRS